MPSAQSPLEAFRIHTEEYILKDNGLLSKSTEAASRRGRSSFGRGLLLDASPCQVDIEEEEEDTEADDGRL
jgi:hypothetical protein